MTALLRYEKSLHLRASQTIKDAAQIARLQAMRDIPHRILVRYVLLHTGDFRADQFCDTSIGADHIDYLPLLRRSMMGTMSFNSAHGMVKHESPWRRMLLAMPLVAMAVAVFRGTVGGVPKGPRG